jgi:NTP pyrophosphatase (non-canonical NTP hydrolase)
MNLDEYLTKRTHLWEMQPYNKEMEKLMSMSNSLGGECGEFQNVVKKIYRDHNGDIEALKMDLILELGDVFWYIIGLCRIIDVDFKEVMFMNMKKLERRQKFESPK